MIPVLWGKQIFLFLCFQLGDHHICKHMFMGHECGSLRVLGITIVSWSKTQLDFLKFSAKGSRYQYVDICGSWM